MENPKDCKGAKLLNNLWLKISSPYGKKMTFAWNNGQWRRSTISVAEVEKSTSKPKRNY